MAAHPPRTGVSRHHVRIEINILGSLFLRLNQDGYEVFNSSARLRAGRRRYLYADVVVVCGEAMFEHLEDSDTLLNPTVVFEVASPSTANYDKGEKADLYRTIPSLNDLVLIAQDKPYAQHYHRLREQEWLLAEYTSLADVVSLTAIDCRLPLADIYRQVLDANETGEG